MTTATNTNAFKYRIVRADALQPGDVISTTRRIIASVEVGENTTITFPSGGMGVVRNTDKIGIYRRTPAYMFAR